MSVIVPSYRRPSDLKACLDALAAQERPADEVIVVARTGDIETQEVAGEARALLPLELVTVAEPGQIAALNVGLANATGAIIAITDDDASPNPEWLRRIEHHFFSDPSVGGVGGRDIVVGNGEALVDTKKVGRIQWFGRTLGNHHLGAGHPRYVDFLKGANMSFDRRAIEGLIFDTELRGRGAQVHNDLGICLAVSRRHWPLIYDPEVRVDHRAGPRGAGDARGDQKRAATYDAAYNETLTLLRHLEPERRLVFLAWGLLAGTRGAPGLLQLVRPHHQTRRRFAASVAGRLTAARDWAAPSHRGVSR